MAFLKRLSDNVWSFLSPRKQDPTLKFAPTSAPQARKRGRPRKVPRRTSLEDVVRRNTSMSPVERVDSWRVGSVSETNEAFTRRKRKAPMTPSTHGGRRRKIMRMDEEDDGDDEDLEFSMSGALPPLEQDEEGYDSDDDNIEVGKSPASGDQDSFYDEAEGDTSLLVSDKAYESPYRKKLISPTQEAFDRGISTEELRDAGWDDDHIVLVQKIAMRGYEPILPHYWKFGWPFMPDALFSEDDDAFLSPVHGSLPHASNALETLFELGGWVRDRVYLNGHKTPEQTTRKMLKDYMKWAEKDSGLDPKTAIPLLVLECKPSTVPAATLQASARAKLARLAQRYRDAFHVQCSIEDSPASRASTILSYPLPTLYAIIASGTLIALVAYNPADNDPDIKAIAFFPMAQKGYDVWNALALAIVVAHVRNVQIRVAEETGVGMMTPESFEEGDEDPDL